MFGGDQRVVGDSDHASAGIALGISKRVELFEVDLSHSGFFAQFAHRGLVETFVFKNKAARNRILAGKGLNASLDQQDFQRALSIVKMTISTVSCICLAYNQSRPLLCRADVGDRS